MMLAVSAYTEECTLYKDFVCGLKVYNDGTPGIEMTPWAKMVDENVEWIEIQWVFDAQGWTRELFVLQCIMDFIADSKIPVELFMPYIPNARMDRVPNNKAFTLKTFARLINEMGFKNVYVADPHSDVAVALIDRCIAVPPRDPLHWLPEGTVKEGLVLVYPDAGAYHRYSKVFSDDYQAIFGEKVRDPETDHIVSYEVFGGEKVEGKDVVIIDDIIAHGYTVYFLLKELEKYKPRSVKVYATHLEDSFWDGRLHQALIEGEVKADLYTTESIVRRKGDLEINVTKLLLNNIYVKE